MKILEKIVNFQIHLFISTHEIITPCQFGFQKNKGTSDALLNFSRKAFKALDLGHTILGIFIEGFRHDQPRNIAQKIKRFLCI